MAKQKVRAHTLVGYQLLDNAESPEIVGIALKTDIGIDVYAATRDMLEELAAAFAERAARMPEPPSGE